MFGSPMFGSVRLGSPMFGSASPLCLDDLKLFELLSGGLEEEDFEDFAAISSSLLT